MFEMSQIGCGLYLFMLSVADVRIRKLPVWILAAGGVAACAVRIYQRGIPVILVLAGAAVGVVFLAVSKVTEEGFGYGDSLLILVLGIYLGFWNLLGILLGAFLLCSLFAIAALAYHRFHRNTGYPFVPFLMASYIVWMCFGGF